MFCENDLETLADDAREVVFQVSRAYLERRDLTATQLVFDPAQHKALLDDGARFQEFLQRIALLQGQHTKRPVAERMKELTALAEAAMDRVERMAGEAPPAGGQQDAETAARAGILLAQLLTRLSSWSERFVHCLELVNSGGLGVAHGLLDQTLSEMLRLRPALAEIFGDITERPRMIDLCLALCNAGPAGTEPDMPAARQMLARGGIVDLPRCLTAIRERLLDLVGGSAPIFSAEPHEEWLALLNMRKRVRSAPELDADWQLATAISRRFARFTSPELLNPLLGGQPEYGRKILLLLQLCREIEDSTARFELHGAIEHYLDHRDFVAKFIGSRSSREDFTELAAAISGDFVTADIPEQRKARMQELFRTQLARVVRPPGSRISQRGAAATGDSVTLGDLSIPLRNWSPGGLLFGPCPDGISIGDRLALTVCIRNPSLTMDFTADAEILRISDGLAAVRYTCGDADVASRIRDYFES